MPIWEYVNAMHPLAPFVQLVLVTAPDGRSHVEHGMIQHIRIN